MPADLSTAYFDPAGMVIRKSGDIHAFKNLHDKALTFGSNADEIVALHGLIVTGSGSN